MGKHTTESGATRWEVRDRLEAELRRRTRAWIVELVEEGLEAALGAGRHERAGERCGYRHGRRERTFTTRNGTHALSLPRGRLREESARSREWHSRLLPRYARRSEAAEQALVAAYLTGTNTRKIRQALEPLLAGAALSRSTVSRMVCNLRAAFSAWQEQDWSHTEFAILNPGRDGDGGAAGREGGAGASAGHGGHSARRREGTCEAAGAGQRERAGLGRVLRRPGAAGWGTSARHKRDRAVP